MYGNQPPPFRPPFPPNLAGGSGTPPSFPPFAPNGAPGGFVPPPFPPNFAPNGTPPNFGTASPGAGLPFRPPVGSVPPRPAHPGLGLPPLPAGLPRPPSFGLPGAPPGFKKDVKTTSVFVGSIAPGVADITLHHMLNACGPLHDFKRPEGANGRVQAFGFAQYESPEVVMRCIRCLNGVELPDMTPEGRRDGKRKALLVKADEKTTIFLQEFEATVGRSDDDESADANCRKSIAHIVALLTDPNAPPPKDFQPTAGGLEPINVVVPAHLQDLKEGDLPENQRVQVLDQIAVFREQAARREREKQKLDVAKERQKLEEIAANPRGTSTSNYGYGNRALENDRKAMEDSRNRRKSAWDQQHVSPNDQRNAASPVAVKRGDPQAYDKPVGFVKPQAAEAKGESERTDEEEEELRLQRKARERDHALRERERRIEDRERMRIGNLNREAARRRQDKELEEKLRRRQKEMFEDWDDDEKIEIGRDWFYVDRPRWRSQRQQARNREFQDDLRDKHREDDERKKLEAESEEFLKKQMEEMAELEAQQKARGLLTEDAAPIKLAMASVPRPEPKEEKKVVAPPPSNVAFDEDEEVNGEAGTKKKRTLVRLEYDGPEDKEISDAEKIARRNAKLLEFKRVVPLDRRSLWASTIEWPALTQSLLNDKLKPFVQNKMKALLGEVDEDLADFVIENLRDQKGPDDMVDGLEPVFAEEAVVFVVSLWRQLVFESVAYKNGYETGTVMV